MIINHHWCNDLIGIPNTIKYWPDVVKIWYEFAPKLVAISIGWIARENIMSEMARAIINTSVGTILLRLRKMTSITNRFRKKLTSTAMNVSFVLILIYIWKFHQELNSKFQELYKIKMKLIGTLLYETKLYKRLRWNFLSLPMNRI